MFHEFGHLYIDLLGITNPVVARAIEQLRDTDLYKRVQENYPHLYGEMLDKEVLATAIGLEGAKIVTKNPSLIQRIINRIMRAFGKLFGITPSAAAVIAEEMFAGNLRSESFVNPLSPYMQESKEDARLKNLVEEARILVKNDLNKLENGEVFKVLVLDQGRLDSFKTKSSNEITNDESKNKELIIQIFR